MNQLEPPSHSTVKSVLRIAEPLLLLGGLAFMAIGTITFFSAFGTFQLPHLFWCCVVGLLILFVRAVMCKFGDFGAVTRLFGV